MITVGISEVKIRLSKLLRRVAKGEEIVITRSGKPVARLVPAGSFGIDRGRIWMAPDFDKLPKGLLKSFYGGLLPAIQKIPKEGAKPRQEKEVIPMPT